MHTKTSIMGVEVDLISLANLQSVTNEYLSNDRLNIYFLLTSELMREAENNETYRNCLQQADLILPGKQHMITMSEELSKLPEMAIGYNALLSMAQEVHGKRSIFLLCEDKKRVERMSEYVQMNVPMFRIVGSYTYEEHLGDEQIINAINAVVPDIVISTLPSPLQEEWIVTYALKVNAKLYIGMGGVIDAMISDTKQPPALIRNLHLENLYYKFKGSNDSLRSRIFQRKLAQYNNKKGEDDNGTFL